MTVNRFMQIAVFLASAASAFVLAVLLSPDDNDQARIEAIDTTMPTLGSDLASGPDADSDADSGTDAGAFGSLGIDVGSAMPPVNLSAGNVAIVGVSGSNTRSATQPGGAESGAGDEVSGDLVAVSPPMPVTKAAGTDVALMLSLLDRVSGSMPSTSVAPAPSTSEVGAGGTGTGTDKDSGATTDTAMGSTPSSESSGTETSTTSPSTTTSTAKPSTSAPSTTAPPTAKPTSQGPGDGLYAFPGAEGFGAAAVGGRGGRVIAVTNLNDSGSGSLRAALTASGPRTIVFRVGGTISLKSRIEVTDPYVTVAGQTAPGDGITIRGSSDLEHHGIVFQTHDAIVRHLRIRPGPSTSRTRDGGVDAAGAELGAHDIIFDHVSFSWTTDEVASTWHNTRDVTFQWSIFSEGLDRSGNGGEKSKGPILGGEGGGNISFHHNLLAHNHVRNPMIVADGIVDVRNNVIYNPDNYLSYSRDQGEAIKINYVNNYGKPGPRTGSQSMRVWFKPERSAQSISIHVAGNISPGRPDNGKPETDIMEPETRKYQRSDAHRVPAMTTHSAEDAYRVVLAGAGATAPKRDSVDNRIVNDVRNGTGNVISDPSQVGGWPTMNGGSAPNDSDGDGMPDQWESANNLNPNDGTDGNGDADGDGYTDLEEYLNQLAG